MPPAFPFHLATAPHRPQGTGEVQHQAFRLFPHWQRCEAGLCVSPYLVHDLLQYDAPRSQGRSALGSVHTVLHWWERVQPAETPGPYKDTHSWFAFRRQLSSPRERSCRFAQAAKAFRLTISLKKTEVMFQKPPREAYTLPYIYVEGYNSTHPIQSSCFSKSISKSVTEYSGLFSKDSRSSFSSSAETKDIVCVSSLWY